MGTKIHFTSEQIKDIIDLYVNQLMPSTKIGQKYGCSYMTITKILKDNNIQILDRRAICNKYDLDKDILPLYNKGISLTKIAKQFNTSRHTLSKELKARGIEIINHQNETKFNEHIFDVIDTEEKAYWLGFIFADGYIDSSPLEENKKSKYGFEISLKGSDAGHLHKFNEFMGHNKDNVKIGYVNCNGKRCVRCRWYVANKHLWNTLNSLGCTSRKSLTLKFPSLSIFQNKKLIIDFIRGYLDGDGSISYIKSNPNIDESNYSPRVSILSTEQFLTILQKITRRGIIKPTKSSCYVLTFSRHESRFLLHKLYDNATIYLDRKYKRAKFFENSCRSAKELAELLAGENGEGCDVNPVVNEDSNESSSL